jgi:phage shock protein PspC (stress-responsive transcriptional regulator)
LPRRQKNNRQIVGGKFGGCGVRFDEVKDIVIEMFTTWQVIAVSVVVILYFFLVSAVASGYRRIRLPGIVKKERKKAAQEKPEAASEDEDSGEDTAVAEKAG